VNKDARGNHRVSILGRTPSPGRRAALKVLGGLGATWLLDASGCGSTETAGAGNAGARFPDGGLCVLQPGLIAGPYWVDERLNRSNITSDTNNVASPNPRPGLPLTLQMTVFGASSGMCTPLAGAQVDVWHCDGLGLYSDVPALGTAGENFLRGYQLTDPKGLVTFTTIYPGWYPTRAVHIHVRIRLFDASSNTTTEATTQLFLDDSVTDTVFQSNAPYDTRGARDTRNAADGFFAGQSQLLFNLSGSATTSYTASIAFGVQLGALYAG